MWLYHGYKRGTGSTVKHKFVPFVVSNEEHTDSGDEHKEDMWKDIAAKSKNAV